MDESDKEEMPPAKSGEASASKNVAPVQDASDDESSEDEDTIEEVKRDETAWEADDTPMKNGRPDIDIITAEAMTLAHQMATGQKTKHDLMDDHFNRYTFRDLDGLPDWFLDDENRHSKIQRPTTAAAAAAIKEKTRALNARPIKKVREAKARKKFKAAQRLEKLKKKSALLADEEGMTEKDKAQSIARLMARAAKKKPKQKVAVVVARGGNNGIKGRPKGTKGKYKMVDARLKKDVRAEKRIAKRDKKKR
jgi:AdoMet-dependent rRNA methyltransferase SPB1